ncbi:helix-turn-helix domain-containing protein [Actinokineospora xionganensis]|uniref:Helix-turn-helix domain-containing protein n=1 Tax=Actinokineospora xionganensis TaxID=2684470 RepID=A0ABR7L2S5_9PSEU|nr:helix-turn-helix transcriptional regulator [Actinokineospora xionganensis]MBC6446793.1 helix-turn-helix domain-containing protein [Actinokineospora xionganensis]
MNRIRLGVNSRGLGAELCRYRKDAAMTLEHVAERLGTSASTICRLETGKREPTLEEVSAILAIVGVVGPERDRLLGLALGRSGGSGMVEYSKTSAQSRSYLYFESYATVITNFQLMLIPGLAQTADYAHAVVSAIQVDEEDDDIEMRIGKRMSRQKILTRRTPPRLDLILSEHALRAPIGGPKVMGRQLRHLIDLADRDNVSLRVIPREVAVHPGLMGQFVILDFAKDPTVVFVEARTTGLFRDDPDEVALYRLTVERLLAVALDEPSSLGLLRSIAEDFDGG